MAGITTPSTYRNYAEQVAHYFARPHDGVPNAPLGGAAAWYGDSLAGSPGLWTHPLSDVEVRAIGRESSAALAAGRRLSDVGRDSFNLPELQGSVDRWRTQLTQGHGFVLVKGLPVHQWGEARSAIAYWMVGHLLGIPGGQNPDQELLGHVKDYRESGDELDRRAYRGHGDIRFHCDTADAVALLCLCPSPRGGASRIASSVTIFNEIMARRPDLIERLFAPLKIDSRGEQRPGVRPFGVVTPCAFSGGALRTFYHGDYFRSVTRHVEAGPHTADEQALLDLYESIGHTLGIGLDMTFEAGDIQIISNHTIVHARSAYKDADDPTQARHLLRLWLSL